MRKGFTLIELLIVVAIIAILAAIAVPNFLEAQTRAKVSRVKSDIRSLATAVETYFIDAGKYPLCYATQAHTANHTFLAIQWQNGYKPANSVPPSSLLTVNTRFGEAARWRGAAGFPVDILK